MSERPSTYGALPPGGSILTTGEYLQTAESVRVQELIYGTLHVGESPTPQHQDLLLELALLLRVFVRQHRLGTVWIAPLDVILDPKRALIVQPDLFFISKRRQDIVTDRVWGAPDMVLEVLSPHPRIGQLDERLRWFAQYGVRECWLVHQLEHEIEVVEFGDELVRNMPWPRRRFRGTERIQSKVVPGFGVAPALLESWIHAHDPLEP